MTNSVKKRKVTIDDLGIHLLMRSLLNLGGESFVKHFPIKLPGIQIAVV